MLVFARKGLRINQNPVVQHMLLLEFPFPQLAPELDPSMLWTEPVGYQQGYDNMTCRAVKHPTLHVLHKCENLICVEVGLLRLQRLMEKPTSSSLVLSAIVCEWFVVHPLVADEFLAANEILRLKETSNL
ncbi:hypothetical protein OUZ56_005538 [Daphnia magna]|uniref:Uncharacterized protein n=1 Tax=Daphnia magna TaxID=35525 RepID=A0ABQ9YT28_9CRUS|nr:hypothetical protein OUZ56_005538 [Daphnia magna]